MMGTFKQGGSPLFILFALVLLIGFTSSAWAADSVITFKRTYGGPIHDFGFSVHQTVEGGYIVTGLGNHDGEGTGDVYLVKTDAEGNMIWERTFGGPAEDQGNSVHQTMDGGFIIAGFTYSYGGGRDDAYAVKTDQDGNLIWEKTFGGAESDRFHSVDETADGGYVFTGYLHSFGGISGPTCLIKTDINGNVLWEKMYGERTLGSNTGDSVQETSDGGFIISGGKADGPNDSDWDVWLIRADAFGNLLWEETYGGADWDIGYSVHEAQDGGFVIGGTCRSFGTGCADIYLIKTDGSGNLLWEETYGEGGDDFGLSVDETSDGGYVITGWRHLDSSVDSDVFVIKTDADGYLLWEKTYGCEEGEQGHSIQVTSDQGLVIAGLTHSYGNWGQFYLIKTDEHGDIELYLQEGDSLWVQTQYMTPAVFNGMALFWGMRECCYGTDLAYNVYRPEGYSGGVEEDPFSCDLSPFMGNTLIFEFKNNAGMVRMKSDAYVWDYGVPGGMVGFCGYPFFFAFYQLDELGWLNREIVEYIPGEVSETEPPHGDLFFSYPSIGCVGNVISAFLESLVISVEIDIKPGSFPNSINLGSQGNVPVAIFSSSDFDATTVDPLTVTLAGASVRIKGKGTPQASREDIDGDGFVDLIVHVDTSALELAEEDTEAVLEGETYDGQKIRGVDTIRIVRE
jgi:hypothetical protein